MTKKEREIILAHIAEREETYSYYYWMNNNNKESYTASHVCRELIHLAAELGFTFEEINAVADPAAERGKHRAERELKSRAETLYLDRETGKTISRAELEQEFQSLQSNDPETYNYTFSEYLRDCLGKNGSLMEAK